MNLVLTTTCNISYCSSRLAVSLLLVSLIIANSLDMVVGQSGGLEREEKQQQQLRGGGDNPSSPAKNDVTHSVNYHDDNAHQEFEQRLLGDWEELCGVTDYGRGTGWGRCYWFSCSDDRALRRCRDGEGTECEMYGAYAYPKCRQHFHNVGCCVCSCSHPW